MPEFEIKTSIEEKQVKDFHYSSGNIRLDFSLRVDKADDLDTFYALLGKASQDIQKELRRISGATKIPK